MISRGLRFGLIALLANIGLVLLARQFESTRRYLPALMPDGWAGGVNDGYYGYSEAPSHMGSEVFPDLNLLHKNHKEINHKNLRDLHACMALKNCGPNQRSVVLLAGYWFKESMVSDA